jgi:hypothetical protein
MYKILIIVLFSILLVHQVMAGESLFGIGNQTLGYLQLPYASSGEARSYELAYTDSMQLNYRNYATWRYIANTIFSVKAGYGGSFSDTDEKKSYNDYANFRGGMLAFPILKKKLVFGISVLPLTSVKQRITDTYTDEQDYTIVRSMILKGGLSRAMGGFAYAPISNVSLFAGFEYTFGTINENLLQELSKNTTSSVNINYDYRYTGNGVVLSAYTKVQEKIGLGFVYRPGITLNCERVGETASEQLNNKIEYDVKLPAEINLGMEYIVNDRYNTGVDFIVQDWDNGYKIDGKKSEYQALFYQIGFGIERKPSTRLFVNLGEQIAYRAGFIHGQLPYTREGETVKINAFSFGFSLPIQRFRSGIDLSMLVGKRGNLSKNGLEENFISLNITINASEIWFKNIDDR